jgi:serine/threonine-protein kinase
MIGKYSVEKIIGEGRYGICYKVSYEQMPYIFKQLKRGMLKRFRAKACYEEEILKSTQHKNIPRFIEKNESKNFYGYVLEYKEGKTIEDIIYFEKHIFLKSEIITIGRKLITILKYLHSKGIVHRDVRVPNVLYDGQDISLIDFGLARWIDNRKYKADMDFAFLGDFLLHLYYTSFESKENNKIPWYEQLQLTQKELWFLKRLMGIEPRYKSILEVEQDFHTTFQD